MLYFFRMNAHSPPEFLDYRRENITVDLLKSIVDKYIQDIKAHYDSLVLIHPSDYSWVSIVQPEIDIRNEYNKNWGYLRMYDFHEDKGIRDLSRDYATKIDKFNIERTSNKEIYGILKAYRDAVYQLEKTNGSIDLNAQLCFEKYLNDIRMKCELSDENQVRYKEMQRELLDISKDFKKNLEDSANNERLDFENDEQLAGLTSDFINKHRVTEDGKTVIRITHKDNIMGTATSCTNPESRKQLFRLFKTRAGDKNVLNYERKLKLHQEIAEIHGYREYVEKHLSHNSILSGADELYSLLNRLSDVSRRTFKNDLKVIIDYTKETFPDDGVDKDTMDMFNDFPFYRRKFFENIGIPEPEQQKYFKIDKVITTCFDIYQRLLSYTFNKIDGYHYWSERVSLYEVKDNETNSTIGYFYMDIYKRDGKFGTASAHRLRNKSHDCLPICVLNCDILPQHEIDGTTWYNAKTFFHEFGHIMQAISEKCYNLFSLDEVDFDKLCIAPRSDGFEFHEIPSTMFELWFENPQILHRYFDIPMNLANNISRSETSLFSVKNFNATLPWIYDDLLANTKRFHTEFGGKLNNLEKYTWETYSGVRKYDGYPGGVFLNGHEFPFNSGYYRYLYCRTISSDIYFNVFKDNFLDPAAGKRFKEEIFHHVGLRSTKDSIRALLGRDYDKEFYVKKTLTAPDDFYTFFTAEDMREEATREENQWNGNVSGFNRYQPANETSTIRNRIMSRWKPKNRDTFVRLHPTGSVASSRKRGGKRTQKNKRNKRTKKYSQRMKKQTRRQRMEVEYI